MLERAMSSVSGCVQDSRVEGARPVLRRRLTIRLDDGHELA